MFSVNISEPMQETNLAIDMNFMLNSHGEFYERIRLDSRRDIGISSAERRASFLLGTDEGSFRRQNARTGRVGK
jgi:hypothetical protein